jgi:hypothetical protein
MVAVADDELLEAVARVERARVQIERLLARLASALLMPAALDAVARELDLDATSEDCLGAGIQDPAKALRYPGLRGRRSVQEELAVADGHQFERLEPDLVGGFAYRSPELRSELAPGSGGLDGHGQGQTTLCGTEGMRLARAGAQGRPGRRIYQRRGGEICPPRGLDAKREKKTASPFSMRFRATRI